MKRLKNEMITTITELLAQTKTESNLQLNKAQEMMQARWKTHISKI